MAWHLDMDNGHGSNADALNHRTLFLRITHNERTDAVASAINLHQFIINARKGQTNARRKLTTFQTDRQRAENRKQFHLKLIS